MTSSATHVFDLLPEEMLSEIFDNLDLLDLCSVSATCKQFYDQVLKDKRLFKKFEYKIDHEWWSMHPDPIIARTLSERGFRRLDVHVSRQEDLKRTLLEFPGQLSLKLNLCRLKECDVIGLLRTVDFTTLKSLALFHCYNHFNIRDLLPDIFPKLESFEIDDECCASYLEANLNIFLQGVRTLKKLVVVGCCFQTFQCKSDTVERLVLYDYGFDEDDLRIIARSFPKLRRLTLHGAMYGQLQSEGDCRKFLPYVPVVRFFQDGSEDEEFGDDLKHE